MSITVSPGTAPILPAQPSTAIASAAHADTTPSSASSVVHISAEGAAMANHIRAKRYIDIPAAGPEIESGQSYFGTVKEIREFGAFVEIAPGRQGLLHVSELTGTQHGPANAIDDYLYIGQVIEVQVTKIDTGRGRISLSLPATPGT